jgi:hypothetical protein
MVRELAGAVPFDVVLETGTFRGTSTAFFAAVTGTPVETVEISARYYEYSRRRLERLPGITVHLGDSRGFLRDQARKRPDATALIYLDAHWGDDLPLAEELHIIASEWTHSIVMIDDFEVPGDTGYEFDEVAPGKALTRSYLPDMPGWALFYPGIPSSEETGRRRGCVVLAPASLLAAVCKCPSLRAA